MERVQDQAMKSWINGPTLFIFQRSFKRSHRLWNPLRLILRAQGYDCRGVKLTTHPRRVPRSRISGAIPPLPTCLQETLLPLTFIYELFNDDYKSDYMTAKRTDYHQ